MLTTSNAASYYFEDFNAPFDFQKIDWQAVNRHQWQDCKEQKQAEFLVEKEFCWSNIEAIVTKTDKIAQEVKSVLERYAVHKPLIHSDRSWYYG